MPDSRKIRVGLIGAGAICRSRHLPGLAAIGDVEVVAVANRGVESAERVAAEFGIQEAIPDWRDLVARPDLDAVFIGSWPDTHRELSIAVLEAGKHCFCQSRMARDLEEARAMLAASRAHPGQVAMLCPPPHRMPFEPYIRDMIQSGRLGRLTLVELTAASGANLEPGVHWRERYEISGLQVLTMGIMAETLNALVGPYERLSAEAATPLSTKRTATGEEAAIRIPQVVTISGRLENGALALERHLGLAADETTPGSRLTIWGLEGTLEYRFGDRIWFAPRGRPLEPAEAPAHLRRGWQVERDFIEAVRRARAGEPWSVSPDFEEGLLYMRKVEAVHRAAASGGSVRPADL